MSDTKISIKVAGCKSMVFTDNVTKVERQMYKVTFALVDGDFAFCYTDRPYKVDDLASLKLVASKDGKLAVRLDDKA